MFACHALCKAYTNGKSRTGKKKETFQAEIEAEYRNLASIHTFRKNWMPGLKHKGNAIFLQLKRIRKDCLRFEESIEKVRQLNLTGSPTDKDVINLATAINNGQINIRTPYKILGVDSVAPGPSFNYIKCYLWLRNQHLWRLISNARMNAVPYSASKFTPFSSFHQPIDYNDPITTGPSDVPILGGADVPTAPSNDGDEADDLAMTFAGTHVPIKEATNAALRTATWTSPRTVEPETRSTLMAIECG